MAETPTLTGFDAAIAGEGSRDAEERTAETDRGHIDYGAEALRVALNGGQALTAEYVALIGYDPQAAFVDAVQGGFGPMGG